ncbi:hypothetical protein [Fodinicurvata sp. EGI_FJ10296]|uniref:hypothetical protein n=1 Tax=Fodinicurvata sp. EGI_FJ10296 TaxID=3231908 RepID=UPI003452CAF6
MTFVDWLLPDRALADPCPGRGGRSIVFLDDNDHFARYVDAVAVAAGVDLAALTRSERLAMVLDVYRPGTVITNVHMPCRDAVDLLPVLHAAGTVRRLVIVAGVDTPALKVAALRARRYGDWSVETWTKPLRTAYLFERFIDFAAEPVHPTEWVERRGGHRRCVTEQGVPVPTGPDRTPGRTIEGFENA